MYILGISCFYHEAAAALLKDGKIVAASAEERFSRKKHDADYPSLAVAFCLKQAGIDVSQLDYIVFYEKPFRKFERNLICSLRYFPRSHTFFADSMKNFLTEKLWVRSTLASKLKINPSKILFVPHHLSHAAASYYTSPFSEAAFLTLDGIGEWTSGSYGIARDNNMYPKGEMKFPHSVGLLYAAFTAYLGFEVNDGEFKVMGMAAYGKPKHTARVKKLYKQSKDGSIKLNLSYFAFHTSGKSMYTRKFTNLFAGLDRFDIAASIQTCTEEIVFTMLSFIYEKTRSKNLVMGGGVALNSVINGLILRKTPFKNLFIFPAAGDDGGSVGAALYAYHHVLGNKLTEHFHDPFLGISFSQKEILDTLQKNPMLKAKKMDEKKLCAYIASKLADGKVVGLYNDRAEFGPRALGHRSILADPRNPDMKDIVNSKIKFREEFRPFAPVILQHHVSEYFSNTNKLLTPYMLGAFKATAIGKKNAPATVHLDGTSRVQTVDGNYKGIYKAILEAFYAKTGVPVLLNTSFNVKGEPIVNSPQDAINTFQNSGIDILVLENYVVEKYP